MPALWQAGVQGLECLGPQRKVQKEARLETAKPTGHLNSLGLPASGCEASLPASHIFCWVHAVLSEADPLASEGLFDNSYLIMTT